MRLFIAMAVSCLMLSACVQTPPPSDAEIEAKFHTYRADFDALANAALESPRIERLAVDGDKIDALPATLATERVQAVASRMQSLGISQIGGLRGQRYVGFSLYTSGLGIGGTSKSLIYSESPLQSTEVKNTDEALSKSDKTSFSVIHKRIDTNWYIEVSAN